jgi:hypothetical protein
VRLVIGSVLTDSIVGQSTLPRLSAAASHAGVMSVSRSGIEHIETSAAKVHPDHWPDGGVPFQRTVRRASAESETTAG